MFAMIFSWKKKKKGSGFCPFLIPRIPNVSLTYFLIII